MNPYIKTNWATNDLISAENLNKIEDGIEAVTFSAADIADYLELLERHVGEDLNKIENDIEAVTSSAAEIAQDLALLENQVGDINTILDAINGEVV